jgi:hypothetical protein
MDKSGTQSIGSVGVWVKLTTFTVRSGYPSTVITNHTLVMDITGTGDIEFKGTFSSTFGTMQFRVVKNGTTVLGTPANTGVVGTITGVSVVPGDTLELQAFTGSFTGTVNAGATNTYLQFTQVTSLKNLDAGSQTINWAASGALGKSAALAGSQSIGWSRAAEFGLEGPTGGSQTINWAAQGDLYQGIHYTIGGSETIQWESSAELLHIPKIVSPPTIFAFADVAASIHTIDGRHVGDFPCQSISGYTWGREDTEVSTAQITVQTQADVELVESLRQWVHWMTLWHDDTPVWTGPIWNIRITSTITVIDARDPAIFMWRTRVPITRTFTDTAPARIADSLWRSMNQLHGMRNTPVVIPGVVDDTFTIAAVADSKMLNSLMDELVKVGLHWTVVAGRPVLGVFPRDPVAELAECDFQVELERRRDGSTLFNDVRVQGQNWAQNAIVDLGGLNLQTIVSMDDLKGAGNIQRAAQQQAKDLAVIRDELVVPPSASLHPQAPLTLEDMIPGKTFIVHSTTVSQLMKLDQVTVSGSPDAFDVQVSLVALVDTGEAKLVAGGGGA